jgi:hypothetical protein
VEVPGRSRPLRVHDEQRFVACWGGGGSRAWPPIPARHPGAAELRPLVRCRPFTTGCLADQGHHRAVSVPDLVVAATAELTGLTVLHVDKDFDLIAGVTGQQVERLQEPGKGD